MISAVIVILFWGSLPFLLILAAGRGPGSKHMEEMIRRHIQRMEEERSEDDNI